ncbi:MAG TPA: AraC family transcriptional regulator [Chitinophagaceae bacterium]|nr:AraC family transcriptional regulator [Chitinophagaceae bacterium]
MKPVLRKVDISQNYSFSIREDICPYFDSHWYYHPEVELTLIRHGSGMQFVGDSIDRFHTGDIVLLGSNLPHLWKSDDVYFQGIPALHVEAVVVHFTDDFWGSKFLCLPELELIKELLEKAKRGIRITGKTRLKLRDKMERILNTKGAQRIECLIGMLDLIATTKEYKLLSSIGFTQQDKHIHSERINKIYTYTFDNFHEEISIKEASAAANISQHYFCRYFKSQTNKTYWQFLKEVRIGYACKLLLEDKMNITEICYACGFNNLSNFNRQFKSVTHKTPLQYQNEYLNAPADS